MPPPGLRLPLQRKGAERRLEMKMPVLRRRHQISSDERGCICCPGMSLQRHGSRQFLRSDWTFLTQVKRLISIASMPVSRPSPLIRYRY